MSVLDQETIAELRALGGAELLVEVFAAYMDDAPGEMQALHDAADAGDAQSMERVAHRFKSASAVVGALRVSELAERLQALGRCGGVEGSQPIVAELDAAWREATADLTALRDGLAA